MSLRWTFPSEVVVLYTIYYSPSDFPGVFVVREFIVRPHTKEPTASGKYAVRSSLETARRAVPPWADHCMPREYGDEFQIVETWI